MEIKSYATFCAMRQYYELGPIYYTCKHYGLFIVELHSKISTSFINLRFFPQGVFTTLVYDESQQQQQQQQQQLKFNYTRLPS